MSLGRDRLLAGTALAVLAAGGAFVVVLLWNGGGAPGPEPTVSSPAGIDAYADLDRYKVQFGDTVTARVEVTVDRSRVDPNSIHLDTDFSPWKAIGAPQVLRRDGSSTTYLQTSYRLRCLESFCTTQEAAAVQTFRPVRVTYTGRSGSPGAGTHTIRAAWPELLVVARYAPPNAGAGRGTSEKPPHWQANLVSLPAASYRLDPWLIVALLLGGAVLLAAAAVALVLRSRRRPAPAATATAARRVPVITPLEYALALLEDPTRVNGNGDQRRALQLVAEGLVLRGDGALAHTARTLAWSRPVPQLDETRALARKARAALEEDGRDAPA